MWGQDKFKGGNCPAWRFPRIGSTQERQVFDHAGVAPIVCGVPFRFSQILRMGKAFERDTGSIGSTAIDRRGARLRPWSCFQLSQNQE